MTGPGAGAPADLVRAGLVAARPRVGLVGAVAVLLAALSLRPLLDGPWWFPRTTAMVLAIVAVGALARTLRLPAPVQPLLQAVGLVATLTLMFAREQAVWGLVPGPAALVRLRDLAAQGRSFADATVPPAGADEGLLLLIVAGVGLIALAVDTLAAGLDLPGLTLVPLASLFAVPWLIAGGSAPAWTFVAVALGWLGILSSTQRDRAAQWSPEARPGSLGAGAAVAAVTTALALLAGGLVAVVGNRDPISIGSGIGPGRTIEIDALVSLRRSLVSNSDTIVMTFETTTDSPDYLRLAVLEEFDGVTWRPAAETALGPLPPLGPAGGASGAGSGELVDYRIDVGSLGGSTLPSPSGTISSLNDWPVAWDQRTSLPVRTDGEGVQGTRVGLVVAPASWDAAGLRAASQRAPTSADVFPEVVADPEPLTGPELPQLAREITAGAPTPYDAAVALQTWFTRDGGFAYSTAVEDGSGEDALATFLDERVGYCEQFSATMALMARAVGIPARVVVGFTQGRVEGRAWAVRGTDAHAWPELWLGSAGWVRFEPTPGAVSTTTPDYTQADADPTQESTTPADEGTGADDASSQAPDRVPALDVLDTVVDGQQPEGLPISRVVAVLALLALAAPAVLRSIRRRRRLRRPDGETAYREVADTMDDLALGAEGATPRETMARIRAQLGSGGAPVDAQALAATERIQQAVEVQRYAAPGTRMLSPGTALAGRGGVAVAERPPAVADAADADGGLRGDMQRAMRAMRRRAGWPRRALAAVAPRSVLRGALGAPGESASGTGS